MAARERGREERLDTRDATRRPPIPTYIPPLICNHHFIHLQGVIIIPSESWQKKEEEEDEPRESGKVD